MKGALERQLAMGIGIIMPDPGTPYSCHHGVLPLPSPDEAGFPMGFLIGLTGVERYGVTTYPVSVRVDDASGDTVFRNANGAAFWAIAPDWAYDPDWVCWLRLPADWTVAAATPAREASRLLTIALLRPSHVEARWTFVAEQDMAQYRAARIAEQNARRAANPVRQLSTTDPEMRIAAFSVGADALHFTIEWNNLMNFPDGGLDILYSEKLDKPHWFPVYMILDIPSGVAGSTNISLTFEELALHGIAPPAETVTGFFKVDILGCGGSHGGGGIGGPPGGDDGEEPPEDFDAPVDSGEAQVVTLVGSYPEDVVKTLSATVTMTRGQAYILAVYTASSEYPFSTGSSSVFNDRLTWDITCPDGQVMSGDTDVNSRHDAWQVAEQKGVSIPEFSAAHIEDLRVIVVPEEESRAGGARSGSGQTTASISLSAVNVGDGRQYSAVSVHLWPLKLVQLNMPNTGLPFNSTDLGMRRIQEIGIGADAVAYVTGEPKPPALRAFLKGTSPHFNVTWGMSIVTERPERKAIDNRTIPNVTLPCDQEWNITQAMNNEILGGKCTLMCKVTYEGTTDQKSCTFFIRGKNPRDQDVEFYLYDRLLAKGLTNCVAFARFMVMKETWKGVPGEDNFVRVYNQFNPYNSTKTPAAKVGTLNWGDPDGWGIGQIDRSGNKPTPGITTTAEAWDWKANIDSMVEKIADKRADHRRFIGYFEQAYGALPKWAPPPASYTINTITFSAEQWATMVLYNGAKGIPNAPIPVSPTKKENPQTPWLFVPSSGNWVFRDNTNKYANEVSEKMRKIQTGEITIKE